MTSNNHLIKRLQPTNNDTVIIHINRDKVVNHNDGFGPRQFWTYSLEWNNSVIFADNAFHCPTNWTAEKAYRDIMGFLTLTENDLDFTEGNADYTELQLSWARSFACECLQSEAYDETE